MNAIRLYEVLERDGELLVTGLPCRKGQRVELIVLSDPAESQGTSVGSRVKQRRPFGLCAGEFTTPADFDEPLPESVLQEFEGK